MATEKVRLCGIEKVYNPTSDHPVHALRGIDLVVEEGEMLGIQGISGSGKSSLLHIIGCLDTPTRGEYYLNGEQVAVDNSRHMARIRNKEIGFVLQQFGLLLERRAIDNVEIPLIFGKVRAGSIAGRARKTMKKLGIAQLANKPCTELSGGEKQRVAIARALVNDPKLVLADEPTGALDTKTRQGIMQVFRDLADEGKTVIIVTHDPMVAQQCDRVLTIEDGLFVG
nr:ABC transporter ATP-binding protein [Maliibacterium massiliense]